MDNNAYKFSYTASYEDWQAALEKSYNKNKGRYRVDGFRQGKAPRKKIESLYGGDVFWNDGLQFIVDDYYIKSLKDENIKAVCEPDFNIDAISDSELRFTCTVQGKPEVKLGKYKGLAIKKDSADVKIDEVDREIKAAQEKAGSWEPVTKRKAKKGDKTTIDFSGSVNGVKFDGGAAEKFELILGGGMFIPGFEEQVEGMKIGEEKDVKVKFPDDYGKSDLGGKDAVFAVKLHEIKEKKLPELNDEFAKDVSEFNTYDEYRQSVTSKIQEQKTAAAEHKALDELIDKIVKAAKVNVPQKMIEEQAESMVEEFEQRIQYQGLKLDDYYKYAGSDRNTMYKQYLERAKERVTASLVFEAIMDKEGIDRKEKDAGDKMLEMLKKENTIG